MTAALLAVFAPPADASVPAGGRVWELVSFEQVTSARTFGVRPMGEDGDEFVYSMVGPPPGSESGPFLSFVSAKRGQAGWASNPLSLPYAAFSEGFFETVVPILPTAFSEDLQSVLWISSVPLTAGAPPEGKLGLYRKVGSAAPELIATVGEDLTFEYGGFADISSDGSRVIFSTKEHLLPGDAGRTEGHSIYEWDGSSLELVDVDNGGTLLSTCGTFLSQANGMSYAADLVFFTVPAACAGVQKVYLRDLESQTTVEISASQCTRLDCNAASDVSFAGALPDGSVAFLTSSQQLTDDDHDAGRDLYRYDIGAEELRLLSGGTETSGEVSSALAYPSDDGSRAYFRGTGEVLPGETTTGEKLFWGDSGGVHHVVDAEFVFQPQINLSADGTRALFVTQSPLLPGDTDAQSDAYLYDSDQESVTQVSTGPSGGNGTYGVIISSPIERAEFEKGNRRPFYAIDAAGERMFFSTEERLLPEDINNKGDIYERWNGELGLVSPGSEEFDAAFGGASRDGSTVIFASNYKLSPRDEDGGNRDFYAARVGGGFPEPEEEAPGCDVVLCPAPARRQLTRPTPESTVPLQRKGGRIKVIRVGTGDAGLVGTSTTVLAAVPDAGLVSADVWVSRKGKKLVVARGSARAERPGKVRIRLRLTPVGRRSSIHTRSGHLTVSEGDLTVSRTLKVSIGR